MLGWTLAAASAITVLPIPVRLIRSRNSEGVSALTSCLGVVTMSLWCWYTLGIRDWPALASSMGPLLAWGITLVVLLVLRHDRLTLLLTVLAIVSSSLAILLPSKIQMVLAIAGSMLWSLPQLRIAVKGGSMEGVSAVAYFAVLAENVGWVLYSIGTGTMAYIFAPIIQGPAAGIIAARTLRSHKLITLHTIPQ